MKWYKLLNVILHTWQMLSQCYVLLIYYHHLYYDFRLSTIVIFCILFILETRITLEKVVTSSSGLQQGDLESREVQ